MPNSYTGNPGSFTPTIEYPANGDYANEESVDPLESLLDNDAYLKAEIENATTGLPALNTRLDGASALNFPYDGLDALLKSQSDNILVNDFATTTYLGQFGTQVLPFSVVALCEDITSTSTQFAFSSDLRNWQLNTTVLAHASAIYSKDLIVGPTYACALQYASANLEIVKFNYSAGSVGATVTAIAGSASIADTRYCGVYFNSVFIWGLRDTSNNAIVVTSTNGTTVSRQAFGTVGDLNHVQGPFYWAKNTGETLLVGLASNTFSQSATFYLTSADGITFTERVFPAVSPGNETGLGLCYNAEQNLWLALTFDQVFGHYRVYSSPDGIAWTKITELTTFNTLTFGGKNQLLTGIASTGQTIAIGSLSIETNPVATLLYSANFGASWQYHPRFAYSSVLATGLLQAKIYASRGQFIFGAARTVAGSFITGQQGQAVT